MYPIIFNPIYKDMIWGGNRLRSKLGRDIPTDSIGESWDISCRKDEMGIVKNGSLAGEKFIDVLNRDRKGYLGTKLCEEDNFPLLVKIIDAKSNLSVQVHPNDEYAEKAEGYVFGKTEMWYILDAPENGYLIIGLNSGVTKEKFREALENGNVEGLLGKLYVKKGDIVNIPAGMVHAITSGILLAEIQQNSDITYRVYDYGRVGGDGKPRDLHIDKAVDVIDFDGRLRRETTEGIETAIGDNKVTYYIANKYFAVQKYDIAQYMQEESDKEKFYIFTCVEGGCEISGNGVTTKLAEGDSVFIPAAMGVYNISGKCVLIKSYVPNIEKDFIIPLKDKGYDAEEIKRRVSMEN